MLCDEVLLKVSVDVLMMLPEGAKLGEHRTQGAGDAKLRTGGE